MNPWNYFAINRPQFNPEKGIFSKLETDRLIPGRFRLDQYYYDPAIAPKRYPVFIKPEWGQNSKGVIRIPGERAYRGFQHTAQKTPMPYLVQQAGTGSGEYEIYYLRNPEQTGSAAFLSITRTINTCEPVHPVNSIYNPCTVYEDVSQALSSGQLEKIWSHVKTIGQFPLARVGVKTDSVETLAHGDFKIIEINLFLPMPLALFAKNVGLFEKFSIVFRTMKIAAGLAKKVPRKESGRAIFFQKLINM